MIHQQAAKIFLAEKRPAITEEGYRCLYAFRSSVETDVNAGCLEFVRDETFAGRMQVHMETEKDHIHLVLPVTGILSVERSRHVQHLVSAGELLIIQSAGKNAFKFTNPYEQELINFLHICFRLDAPVDEVMENAFDIHSGTHPLVSLFTSRIPAFSTDRRSVRVLIGKFGGRTEGTHILQEGCGIYALAIEGVFECQDRLLQAGDGLFLNRITEISFEALSHDAILLLIEMPL